MNDTEVTQVVCAAIIRDGKYLICRREPSDHLGGYWEFPGERSRRRKVWRKPS
jgi:hypothetical protein